ncbi:prolyl oligopeptidase family serine peptidase [Leptobacterium flavescens]|uniref:Prolyl oligopeptidase family serine peptidase n=1 Tax=Leptobacterium flavescens TaxID=472055 RepID=A0A6P0ULC6_9FLAO|nr:prolyl oligopeptidase family serine peptidase [Leptobacterium flavescens]NER12708.1 prolyl oligopeptidase family serine peptidase [Leptobacterium flavescens]
MKLKKNQLVSCLLASFFCLIFSSSSYAQESITKEDYQRAKSFLWENINNKKAFNLRIFPNWFSNNTGFWYLKYSKEGKAFKKVLFANAEEEALFDHSRLAEKIATLTKKEVKATELPFNFVEYVDKDHLEFRLNNKTYVLDLGSYDLKAKKKEESRNAFETTSPDGKWVAYSENYNLYLKSTETGEVKQLSRDGYKNYEYASFYGWYDLMEGENGNRPKRFFVSWSPDSKYIQTSICDLRYADKMYMLDFSIDSLYRPKLLSYYRGSPGDTTMVHMKPVFFDIENSKEITPELPRNTHINAPSYSWGKNSGEVFVSYDERGYQKSHLLKLDLKSNSKNLLHTETSNTNIDNFDYWILEKKNTVIFSSEKSGWKQLYSVDLGTKEVTPLTKGDYFVNSVSYIDEDKGIVYFLASGKEEGSNPYHQYLYKVGLKDKKVRLLTPEKTHHQISFSRNGKYFLDNFSTVDKPTKTVLRSSKNGKVVLKVSEADIAGLTEANWTPPQTFTTTARDGKTTIYGALWKPTNFDPSKKYPIVDASYTGPHTQMYPAGFRQGLSHWVLRNNQALAELGFIVVSVDGLGSSGRSKEFHNHSYKNLGGNLEDHVLAIKSLGKKYNWIDTDKVGIFGHSAGGYDAAHALLQFPDFYKVAVSSSADHDHRMEKAWWPEMYMGWPVDKAYHEQSNITMASKLKGKLLLVHGGVDNNVNPSATFKLAEALIKADKDFDLLIIPSQNHGYSGKFNTYFTKRKWNYFIEHLRGIQPLWNFD